MTRRTGLFVFATAISVVGIVIGLFTFLLSLSEALLLLPPIAQSDPPPPPVISVDWQRAGLIVASILIGVVCGDMYARLSLASDSPVDVTRIARSTVGGARFWMALCVSPFLFFATFSAIGAEMGAPAAVFLAFQNGFFWNTVFSGFQRGSPTSPPA